MAIKKRYIAITVGLGLVAASVMSNDQITDNVYDCYEVQSTFPDQNKGGKVLKTTEPKKVNYIAVIRYNSKEMNVQFSAIENTPTSVDRFTVSSTDNGLVTFTGAPDNQNFKQASINTDNSDLKKFALVRGDMNMIQTYTCKRR